MKLKTAFREPLFNYTITQSHNYPIQTSSVVHRSCRCTIPSNFPPASTTISDVIFFSSITASAVAANSPAAIVFGDARHRLSRGQIHHIFPALLQQPPQIAIADDPHQPLALDHCRHAQLLPRHLINHVRHLGLLGHARQRLAGMHQRLHPRQPLPQLPPGMQVGKILFLEPAPFAQCTPPAHRLVPASS